MNCEMKEESIICRMCGEPLAMRSWGGGECGLCGSISIFHLPSNAELSLFYNSFNTNYSGGGGSGGKNLIRYAQRYLRLIDNYIDNGTLLDIGSSNSPFPILAADHGFEVTIMDYSRPKVTDSRVRFVSGNLNEEIVKLEIQHPFDVVTAWAVLEHVRDPNSACKLIANLCRSNGTIFISTPEIGTLLTNHSIGYSGWFSPPEHLHLISPKAIALMFGQCGFDIVKWGRLELNTVRYLARYGIGTFEAFMGAAVQWLSSKKWMHWRDIRKHLFKGITYYVLQKKKCGPSPKVR